MKRKLMVLFIAMSVLFYGIGNAFVDTVLDSAVQISQPATKLRQYSFTWNPDNFVVNYNFLDADGNIVRQKQCVIRDWVEVVTPASCSDAQYNSQVACEAEGETWTAAVLEVHNDFSSKDTAKHTAGMVGKMIKKTIKKALQNACKSQWGLTGTE